MPRQPRLDAPETLHHRMVRGSERWVLFRSLDRGPRPSGPPPRARPRRVPRGGPPSGSGSSAEDARRRKTLRPLLHDGLTFDAEGCKDGRNPQTVDLCRTILVGQPPAEAEAALQAYLLAQEAGIRAASPGAPLMGVGTAMADTLKAHGFGDAFLRPVFHGVGIEHEEAPIPGGHAVIHGEEKVENVEVGMVLAIGNCGIYRESFGVRAEDTVWVGPDGPVPLAQHPKALAV